jgi:hypothetical protein
MKDIDPVDIKMAINNGQLKVFVYRGIIYISDTTTGDTVKIGNVEGDTE